MCTTNDIRFLTIGGRVAYGENVPKKDTYPYLLCDGDRIVGPDLEPDDVAPCIKKILGNNVYDVIVLDLFDHSSEILIKLTSRLTKRFPSATIMNLRQFFPGDVGFQHRKGWVSVATWARAQGFDSMTKEALEAFKNTNRPWTVKTDKRLESYYERNSRDNYIWSVYKDPNDRFGMVGDYWKEALLRRAWMYDDWFEVNAVGHKDIARGIFEMTVFNKTDTKHSDDTAEWEPDSDEDDSMC